MRSFWPILLTLLIADCASKELAETYLAPEHTQHELIGSVVRLTLAHNLDGAMGLSLGSYSRIGLALLALLALFVLGRLYLRTPATARSAGTVAIRRPDHARLEAASPRLG